MAAGAEPLAAGRVLIPGRGNRDVASREGCTVSNGIGILAIVLAFAVIACLFGMFVMVRRSSARLAPQAQPQPQQAETASAAASEATQRQLDEAVRQADLLRERAESDAA